MRFRDMLLQIDSYPATTPDGVIDTAVAFAKTVGGQLGALAVQVDIPLSRNFIADTLIDLGGLEKEWEAASLAGCRAAIRHFEATAKAAGVFAGADIQRINLYRVDDILARRARTRDLCMVPLTERYDGQIELARQVIFESGRPVLVLSGRPIVTESGIGEVAVAWDGSRSAARALADALPILKRASAVRLVTFVNEKDAAAPGLAAEAARHLAAHGITAAVDEVDAKGVPIGRAIDGYLSQKPASLLVMGAYGRPRAFEFVLGGATEHVLRYPPTALFLSH